MAEQRPGSDAGQYDAGRQDRQGQQGGHSQRGQPTGPLAREPRRRRPPGAAPRPPVSRLVTWLTWWVLLMSLWVAVDDSFESDELIGGALVAAVAALAAEVVTNQADTRFKIKLAWLPHALRLPGQVVHDTVVVFGALAKSLLTRAPLPSGRFEAEPVSYGDDTPLGVTRRVLLVGAKSLAPNEFVLGMDSADDIMLVHRLADR
jgi:multisubunit Na+/H+ antiporter MnhE subunit